jgi:hypothetical protein
MSVNPPQSTASETSTTITEDEVTISTSKFSNTAVNLARSAQAILLLISHASSPPLQALPTLKYDLRSVPNPPKHIRDNYTGLDNRLDLI